MLRKNTAKRAAPKSSNSTRRLRSRKRAKVQSTRRMACDIGTVSIDGVCQPIDRAFAPSSAGSVCAPTEGITDYSTLTENFTAGCIFDSPTFSSAFSSVAKIEPKDMVKAIAHLP